MSNPATTNPFGDDDDLFAALSAAASAAPAHKPLTFGPNLGDDTVLEASRALSATATVAGMTRAFLPHQAAAFLYILGAIARFGGALLGHDMGLGKTQVFLAAIAQRLAEVGGYAIIVGPPVAKGGYMADLQAAFPHLRFAHLQGRKVYALPPADIYFMSDDSLTMRAWLTAGQDTQKRFIVSTFARHASIIVRDEIHRDKGQGGRPSARAKVMLAVSAAVRELRTPIIGVTGTLLTNRPVEAFIPLQIVGGEDLVTAVTPGARKASAFLFRYCGAQTSRFGTSFNGVDIEKMADLHDYLRRTAYCRIEKSDLGDALPHGGWIHRPDRLMERSAIGRYNRLEQEFLALMLEEEGPEAAWRMARAEVITRMMALWSEAGVAKVAGSRRVRGRTGGAGPPGGAVLLPPAGVQRPGRRASSSRGIDCSVINGKVTGEHRLGEVADFQAGRSQVMLAQIRAAGMAVTLTAAADAVFCQVPWSALAT